MARNVGGRAMRRLPVRTMIGLVPGAPQPEGQGRDWALQKLLEIALRACGRLDDEPDRLHPVLRDGGGEWIVEFYGPAKLRRGEGPEFSVHIAKETFASRIVESA